MVRYQEGFAWSIGPNAKDLYVQHDGAGKGTFYWGFHEGVVGGHVERETRNRHAPLTWAAYNRNSSVSDGRWRCWELHLVANTGGRANGKLQAYLDGAKLVDWDDVRFASSGTAEWSFLLLGENQNSPNNLSPNFTDYDDLAISGARVGCSTTPGTLATDRIGTPVR